MYKRTVENTIWPEYINRETTSIYRIDTLLTFLVYKYNYMNCLTACQEAFSLSSYIVADELFRQGWR